MFHIKLVDLHHNSTILMVVSLKVCFFMNCKSRDHIFECLIGISYSTSFNEFFKSYVMKQFKTFT